MHQDCHLMQGTVYQKSYFLQWLFVLEIKWLGFKLLQWDNGAQSVSASPFKTEKTDASGVDERCALKLYQTRDKLFVFNSIVDVSFFPLPASLGYNLHIKLYTFKVYKVLTWYPSLLQNHIAGSSCTFVLLPFNITTEAGCRIQTWPGWFSSEEPAPKPCDEDDDEDKEERYLWTGTTITHYKN